MKVRVKEIFQLIKESVNMDEMEFSELENSFFEMVNLKVYKILGEFLNEDQRQSFIEELLSNSWDTETENIGRFFEETDDNSEAAKEGVRTAVNESLLELVGLLGNKIPTEIKTKIGEMLL